MIPNLAVRIFFKWVGLVQPPTRGFWMPTLGIQWPVIGKPKKQRKKTTKPSPQWEIRVIESLQDFGMFVQLNSVMVNFSIQLLGKFIGHHESSLEVLHGWAGKSAPRMFFDAPMDFVDFPWTLKAWFLCVFFFVWKNTIPMVFLMLCSKMLSNKPPAFLLKDPRNSILGNLKKIIGSHPQLVPTFWPSCPFWRQSSLLARWSLISECWCFGFWFGNSRLLDEHLWSWLILGDMILSPYLDFLLS